MLISDFRCLYSIGRDGACSKTYMWVTKHLQRLVEVSAPLKSSFVGLQLLGLSLTPSQPPEELPPFLGLVHDLWSTGRADFQGLIAVISTIASSNLEHMGHCQI